MKPTASEPPAADSNTTIRCSLIPSEILDDTTPETVLEQHPETCHCHSCFATTVSWAFMAEKAWLTLLMNGFTPEGFQQFESTIIAVKKHVLEQKKRVACPLSGKSAMGSLPPTVARLYLDAVLHTRSWTKIGTLRKVDKVRRMLDFVVHVARLDHRPVAAHSSRHVAAIPISARC